MTANAMLEDREECIRAGMDDFLPKPVSPADLASALEACAETRAGSPIASESAPAPAAEE